MIIGQIIGGLGNQMFQYSFYKYLSLLKKCDLKLDISLFDSYKLHNGYELESVFKIIETKATQEEINIFKSKYPLFFKVENKLFKKNLIFGTQHYKENKFSINQKIFDNLNTDFYIEGYFQTFKYIQEMQPNLFEFQTHLTESEKKLLQGNIISIHIRGGDYVTNRSDNKLFGNICTSKYYYNAISYIKEYIENPIFLIFTNDKEYTKKLLDGENFKIIDWNNGKNSFRDMYLMSQCKHNIIANSSFSWWGAWLNTNNSKIVVAPNKWFNDSSIHQKDIIPPTWIKVSSF